MEEHFTLEEMSYSRRVAVENGIDNRPAEEACEALKYLVAALLEPLRRLYGGPIVVTSGYRCKEVNRLVGGVPDSQHMKGEAADCYVPDVAKLLALLRRSGLEFDQAIHYRKRNFLHLSLKRSGANRMQVLLRLLVMVFLLSGCGLSRQSHRQESAACLDTVRLSYNEMDLLKKDIRLVDTIAWELHQVVYFTPDSTGKQYPKAVMSLRMDRRRQLADTGKIVTHQQTDYGGWHMKETAVRTKTRRANRSPGYFLCGLSLLLAFGCFLYRRLRPGAVGKV